VQNTETLIYLLFRPISNRTYSTTKERKLGPGHLIECIGLTHGREGGKEDHRAFPQLKICHYTTDAILVLFSGASKNVKIKRDKIA